MKDISWIKFSKGESLDARRTYLSNIFKDKEKKINKLLFVVNPVNNNDTSISYWKKKKIQSINFLKDALRHTVLPFPITWSHGNTDRLVKKNTISMEDYAMGEYYHKDFISALRTGAPQYRSFFSAVAFTTLSLGTLAASIFSLGAVPAFIVGCIGIPMAGYFGYVAVRASKKTSQQVGVLKSKMASLKKNEILEKEFSKVYDFCRLLEGEKQNLSKNPMNSEDAWNSIVNTIEERFNTENKDDKEPFLLKLLAKDLQKFIDTNIVESDTSKNVIIELDALIKRIREINIKKSYYTISGDLDNKLKKIRTELEKGQGNTKNPKLILLDALEKFENETWCIDKYKRHIEASELSIEDKKYFSDKLGGFENLNLVTPLKNARILEMKKFIEDAILQSIRDMHGTDHSRDNNPEAHSRIESEMISDRTLSLSTLSSQVELDDTDRQGYDNPSIIHNSYLTLRANLDEIARLFRRTPDDTICRTENLDSDGSTTTRATASLRSTTEKTPPHEVYNGEVHAFPQTPLTALALEADNERYRRNCPAPPPSWERLLGSNRSTNEFNRTPTSSIDNSINSSTSETCSNLSRLSPELIGRHDRLSNKGWKVRRVVRAPGYKLTQLSTDSFLVQRKH